MCIRRAENKDAARVLQILEQVNLIHHNLRPDLFNIATKYSEAQLHSIFADDSTPVFVYEENGVVLGYIFTVLFDHGGDRMLVPIKELYIDDLCVDEAYRGKHIATKLYEFVKDYAKKLGCHNITLNVWEGNDSALSFYQKMGMKPQKTKLETILD